MEILYDLTGSNADTFVEVAHCVWEQGEGCAAR